MHTRPTFGYLKRNWPFLRKWGGKVAEEWIDELPKEKWVVSYSLQIKCYGEMTSNPAEQFNAWIKEARSLPITHMIDHILAGL